MVLFDTDPLFWPARKFSTFFPLFPECVRAGTEDKLSQFIYSKIKGVKLH
jgi:hypothetical protein